MIDKFLTEIFEQQEDYDLKVRARLFEKYPTKAKRLFAKVEALQNEVAELKALLKPTWSWWRNEYYSNIKLDSGEVIEIPMEQDVDCCDFEKEFKEELIDCSKFLFSTMLEMGMNPLEFYQLYMEKHKIIEQRLQEPIKYNK